jgi:uncharacterized protein (TIGR03067 family)
MRGTCLSIVALALLAAGAPLLGGNKDSGASDLKKIQGTWRFVSHEANGKKTPPDEVAKLKITFQGDKFTVTKDDQVVQAGTNKLDPSKTPAHIDAKITEGDGKGHTMLGVYELKGDTIRVCFDTAGKERPTSLTAKDGQMEVVIQREKKTR